MLLKKIQESKNIIISSHVNPDGDSIGSGLALYWAIKKIDPNKNVRYIIEDDVPYNLKFLKGSEIIEKYKDLTEEPVVDLFFTVDSANFKRIGRVGNFRKEAYLINIDHHVSNDEFGDLNIVEESSSACEIMYGVIKDILKVEIDKIIGECLYTGITTDSGSFKYQSTTGKTFKIAGELIEVGIDRNKIIDEVYKSRTMGYIKTLGMALSRMQFIKDKKMVYFTLSKDFIERENIKKDETDGIVEKMLEYKDCDIAVFLKEDGDYKIKGSLRSKKEIDVNEVAKIFDGGGHKRAAGFTTELEENEIIMNIIEKI